MLVLSVLAVGGVGAAGGRKDEDLGKHQLLHHTAGDPSLHAASAVAGRGTAEPAALKRDDLSGVQ